MVPTSLALAGLTAKLIATGVAAYKAHEVAGWGTEEATAFEKALNALPALASMFGAQSTAPQPLTRYCEAVTVAFGEAWRRHWYYDATLAPNQSNSHWYDWFRGRQKQERIKQVADRLQEGGLETAILGDGSTLDEVRLLTQLDEPLRSPWYRSLWAAFNRSSAQVASADAAHAPPLLLLEQGGKSKARFEQHFRLAFAEALATPRAATLVQWLELQKSKTGHRAMLIRRLLASRLSSGRTEHVFGEMREGSNLPYLPLEEIYVEPQVRRLRLRGSTEQLDAPEPALQAVENLLQDPQVWIVVVLADFGRGKSLTARTLSYRFAERFLANTSEPSPDVPFPVFARCQDHLRSSLGLKETARAAQRATLVDVLPVEKSDAAFELTLNQSTLVLLDGLDEVQLGQPATKELFDDLLDNASNVCRVVVFSRPAAIPEALLVDDRIAILRIQDFAEERVQWLKRWQRLASPPCPSLEDLEQRNLFELCAVPVLLFMTAQTWGPLAKVPGAGRVDVYESFVRLMARSKLSYDQSHHPAVYEAATVLARVLSTSGHLQHPADPVDALIEFQSRLAWKAHGLRQSNKPRALTAADVHNELYRLGLTGSSALVERGVLLSMATNLTDDAAEVHFGHESFREFLVAKYWETRILRILALELDERSGVEKELLGARLLTPGSQQSARFLVELLKRHDTGACTRWAQKKFLDETVDGSLRKDQRYALREAALMLACELSSTSFSVEDPLTLATMLASFAARGEVPAIIAPRLTHRDASLHQALLQGADLYRADLARASLKGANLKGAYLARACLEGANLEGANLHRANIESATLDRANLSDANLLAADLDGAKLQGAILFGANLQGANLSDATLEGAILSRAHLLDAKLQGANLQGANFASAILFNANVQGANLQGANFTSADLSGAYLQGANLQGANLWGANFTSADLSGVNVNGAGFNSTTTFPQGFDPQAHGMLRVEAPRDADHPPETDPRDPP